MKNLAVLILLLIISAKFVHAQQSEDNAQRRIQEIQEEFRKFEEHKNKILQQFFDDKDGFFNPDMDAQMEKVEQMFEQMQADQLGTNPNKFMRNSNSVSTHWLEKDGERVLVIVPQNPQSKLDIELNDGMVQISGSIKNESEGSQSLSQFSNSFSVPSELDFHKAKMEQQGSEIWIRFPYREGFSSGQRNQAPVKDKKLKRVRGGVSI